MKETIRVGELAVDVRRPAGAPRGAAMFVHGFGSRRDGEKATRLGEAAAADGRLFVAPDLRGHGDSGGSFEELTIGRSVEDVVAVAEGTGFASAGRRLLIGSSFGGLVAAWACAEQPDLCDTLVLIAPAFGFVERHVAMMPERVVSAWRAGELLTIQNEWLDVRLSNRILFEAETRPLADLAARLQTPTKIIHGRRDEQVPFAASLDFAALRPATDVYLVGEGDHRLTAHIDLLIRQTLE